MSRSAIKEIITEKNYPETREVIKIVDSGQLNVQSAIYDFYENLVMHKPYNDEPEDVRDFLRGITVSKVSSEEAENLDKPLT